MNVNMDKENKQADTMSVSTISNGGYNYETPPPAYQSKKSTAVALAKIAATTILAAAFILGAFIVAASYVSALSKCSCPDTHSDPQHHVTSRKLPQAAAFVGLHQDSKHDALSKIQEEPKTKVEKEVSIPIAVTTTTTTEAPVPEEKEEVGMDDTVFGDEEATEEEVPVEDQNDEDDVQQRVMDLLKKMVEIDPSMRGNMKCRVSKQKMMPIEPRGILPNKPVLQVHCTKTVIRPIASPFGRGPQIVRIPPPLASSGLLRMSPPLPFNGLPNFPAPDIPQPPGLFNKPQTPDLKIPMMLKLLSNLPLLQGPQKSFPIRRIDETPFSPLDDTEEEDAPPFPVFPERRIIPLGNQERTPNARFMIPLRRKDPVPFPIDDILNELPQKSERKLIKIPFPFVTPPKPDQGFSPRILPFGRPIENNLPHLPNRNLVPPKLEGYPDFSRFTDEATSFDDDREAISGRFPIFRAPEPPQENEEDRPPLPFMQGLSPPKPIQPQTIRFVQVPENKQENEEEGLDFMKPPMPQQEQSQRIPIPFFRIPDNQEENRPPHVPLFQNQHSEPETIDSQPPAPFFPLPEPQQNHEQPIPVPVQIPFFQPPNQPQGQSLAQDFPREQYAPEFNAPEPNTEEQAPAAPQGPVVIPLRRDEPFRPHSFPLPNPLSIIDRIKNLQNVPQPVSPRTYHLNKHTIAETDKRGAQAPVEISGA